MTQYTKYIDLHEIVWQTFLNSQHFSSGVGWCWKQVVLSLDFQESSGEATRACRRHDSLGGSGGMLPRKILKHLAQIGAIWVIWAFIFMLFKGMILLLNRPNFLVPPLQLTNSPPPSMLSPEIVLRVSSRLTMWAVKPICRNTDVLPNPGAPLAVLLATSRP